jgi:Zn-dependent protease
MLDLSLTTILYLAITMVIALTVHEFSHAWTADQLGDDTPRLNGRLTLNPLAHLDPLGSLLIILAGFGWAKPVPVNPYALQRRTRAGMMLVSAAGPFSNLLLAILASLPFRMGLIDPFGSNTQIVIVAARFLFIFISINLVLLFFNLIPIYPLDGEKVAEYFLPPGGQDMLSRLRPYGPMILMGIIFLGRFAGIDLLGILIGTPTDFVFNLLIFQG